VSQITLVCDAPRRGFALQKIRKNLACAIIEFKVSDLVMVTRKAYVIRDLIQTYIIQLLKQIQGESAKSF